LEDLPQGTPATVLQAKQMLIDSLRAHNRIDNKVKPADLSWLICETTSPMTIDSLAEDEYDVNKVSANHRIFAYFAPPHKQHSNAVLLQVCFDRSCHPSRGISSHQYDSLGISAETYRRSVHKSPRRRWLRGVRVSLVPQLRQLVVLRQSKIPHLAAGAHEFVMKHIISMHEYA
jgi:hypothetical protein